jgi:hypothetical protein
MKSALQMKNVTELRASHVKMALVSVKRIIFIGMKKMWHVVS